MTIATRRRLIIGAGALAAVGAAGAQNPGSGLRPTLRTDLGPFYPVVKPGDKDRDLTRVKGRKGRAAGQHMLLTGRVLKPDGKPIAGAALEIWQADANGRYGHPNEVGDHVTGQVDPFFQHYARQKTDADGRYSFLTVLPPDYAGGIGPNGPFMRAAHIHFDVSGKQQRSVTQMYLPGSDPALLAQDFVLHRDLFMNVVPGMKLEDEMAPLIGAVSAQAPGQEPGVKLCAWDIVLEG